jgi:hypothetical protein
MLKEKYISEAQMKEEPKKKLVLKIKEGSITPEHFNKREVENYLQEVVGSIEDTGMLPEDKAKLDALPTASELQNTLNGKQNSLTFDSAPTENSANPVYSGGIKSYVDNHIPTTDATPTQGSNNPVSSNGVYQAIQAIDVSSQISGKLDKTEAAELYQPKGNYLTEHQDISGKANIADVYTQNQTNTLLNGKQNTISNVTVAVDANTGTPAGTVTFSNNTLAFDFQNLKGAKGDTGERGIQGVRGERGPVGANGVTTDANIAIITGIDKTTAYDSTKDVASAEAVQDLVKMLGTVYYTQPT